VRVVSGLTLLSRFAGLARDVLTARMFGDGALGSAFRAAYALPNFFRRLFGEGALSAAFLPEYALLKRDDPRRAGALAGVVLRSATLATGAITGAIVLVLLLRLALWPPSEESSLSIRLIVLMLPMMPAVCLAAILGGMLQASGRFAAPAAAPILLNLMQIVAGALFYLKFIEDRTTAAYAVGIAALLASWGTVAWALRGLRGQVAWRAGAASTRESARRVLTRFVPAALGLGTLQVNTMMDTVVAMWPIWIGPTMLGFPTPLDHASNAILSYTQTLYQFPLGVFGIAVATAVFPLLSRSSDRAEEFVGHLRRGIRLSLFIGVPASLGLVAVRHDLVATIFGGGAKAFSDDGLARSALVLLGFAPAVWLYSLNHVWTRAYYAKGDTRTPMRIAMGAVALNITLNFALVWHLREAGLAWATAASALAQCVALACLAPARLGVRPLDRETLGAGARIALVSLAMFGAVVGVLELFPASGAWKDHALRLGAAVLAGAGVYGGLSAILRAPEVRWLLTRAPAGMGRDGMAFE
jgi:putative peptidoglycan lipid II flippase